MNDEINLINNYNKNLNFIRIIFEKKNGYRFLILFYKNTTTCNDIYKIIDDIYKNNKFNCLYTNKIFIKRTNEIFFTKYEQFLCIEYKLLDKIYYKIILDDNTI